MDFIIKVYEFGINNYELVLALFGMLLAIIGIVIEGLVLLYPTSEKKSALERAGKVVSMLLSKLPQNIKKEKQE